MARTKDFDYFGHFADVCEIALKAAELLHDFTKNFDYSTVDAKMSEIHEYEHAADTKKHEMMEKLAHEFITPIERDDIAKLAEQLDDIVDSIDDVARAYYKYNVKSVRAEAAVFTEKIVQACNALNSLITEFKSFKTTKNLRAALIAVKDCEGDGDVIHAEALRKLYSDDSSDRDVLIWTNIFEELEDTLDSAEDCAGIIESAVLNNT